MPLTPQDVQNKQFKVAFRGYSLDEVDAFLDEVESEIGRLLRENDELKQSGGTTSTPVALAKPEAPVEAAAPPAERPLAAMEGQEAALRTLLLAQRTADEAVAEARAEAAQIVEAARAEAEQTLAAARAEADTTLTDARAEAERTVTEAQAEAESTLTGARTEAESTLTSARTEAESTLTSARTEAESTLTSARTEAESTLTGARSEAESALASAREASARADAEIASRVSEALGDLDERRTALERHIEDLRAFEREYRTRLKAYLQTQLHDLEDRGGPEDGGAGVPAGAPARATVPDGLPDDDARG